MCGNKKKQDASATEVATLLVFLKERKNEIAF